MLPRKPVAVIHGIVRQTTAGDNPVPPQPPANGRVLRYTRSSVTAHVKQNAVLAFELGAERRSVRATYNVSSDVLDSEIRETIRDLRKRLRRAA